MALPMTGGGGAATPPPPHHARNQPTGYKFKPVDPDQSSLADSPTNVNGRSSFSSIREDDQDLAQAFTTSKVSVYAHRQDEAVDDEQLQVHLPLLGTMVSQADFFPPVTRPDSRLHGNWFPADNFKGWKQINVKGRLASRSFSDLTSLNLAWHAHSAPAFQRRRPSQNLPGAAPIEKLPLELLSQIIGHLVIDIPPNSLTKRNIDLMALLMTSKKMHGATLVTLYRQITIPHSVIFKKFLSHIASHAALGTLVRRFDFCHFNPGMMFDTASERSRAQNLTATTLLQALNLTPHLQEFLAQEHIDTDLDDRVLRKLFFGLDRIAALDFCGCTSTAFRTAFVQAVPQGEWTEADLGLKRLSLHKCTTLPSTVFESLLPHLPRLTHLDVAGTRITDAALASIPHTARITHLNLAKCNNLSADAIINFLSTHPAVASPHESIPSSLVWLSLSADASTHETFNEEAVTRLLPVIPQSVKSLSLKGSKMDATHLPLLLPLTKHLEELALGRGLSITDTNALFVPDVAAPDSADPDAMDIDPAEEWQPHTLRYLDLSDLWSTELDLPTLYDTAQCALLTHHTQPLEVVEVHADVGKRVRPAPLKRLGWHSSEAGARTWLVRDSAAAGESRMWKMGAESWGMRKVPVARADVGGMYGSYMFARKL